MGRKHTYEYVYDYFLNRGCLLLEDNYNGNKVPLNFKCSCGEISSISFNHFLNSPWCNICGKEKSIKNRFLNIEYIRDELLKNNCILLTEKYYSNKQILDYICSCGRTGHTSWNNLQYGMFCKECGKEKRSGKNHYNYDPSKNVELSHKLRYSIEYRKWVKNIHNKYHSICQICGSNQNIEAHHLYSYSLYENLRFDINNGICLCKKCHTLFHKIYKKNGNTKEQFDEYFKNYKIS